jgi:hypothetical protein
MAIRLVMQRTKIKDCIIIIIIIINAQWFFYTDLPPWLNYGFRSWNSSVTEDNFGSIIQSCIFLKHELWMLILEAGSAG